MHGKPCWSKNIIEKYYTKLKNARNPLKGSDLLRIGVEPGPKVQVLLNEVMNAYLDGIIENSGRCRAICSELHMINEKVALWHTKLK